VIFTISIKLGPIITNRFPNLLFLEFVNIEFRLAVLICIYSIW